MLFRFAIVAIFIAIQFAQVALAAPPEEVRLARMPFGVCSISVKICKFWRPDGANSLASREELYRNDRLESSIYVSPTATLSMQQQFAKIISATNNAKRKKIKCRPEYSITSGLYKVNKVEVCVAQLPAGLNAQLKNLLR